MATDSNEKIKDFIRHLIRFNQGISFRNFLKHDEVISAIFLEQPIVSLIKEMILEKQVTRVIIKHPGITSHDHLVIDHLFVGDIEVSK